VIAVIHAYSRVNAGDGLLVDLTMQRLARAGVAPEDVTVVAMDAAAFADLPHVVKLGTSGRRADRETAGGRARRADRAGEIEVRAASSAGACGDGATLNGQT